MTRTVSNGGLPNHLGGHAWVTHIDGPVIKHLARRFSVKRMYDVGCGPGWMLREASKHGIEAVGIDGDFTLDFPEGTNVIIHDFTSGPLEVIDADLCWTCEFLEHVHERYVNNYFSVFNKCNVVFCTFSVSKKGHHHVNVKGQEYWDHIFASQGFKKDIDETNVVRKISGMKRDFVRNTGTVYCK